MCYIQAGHNQDEIKSQWTRWGPTNWKIYHRSSPPRVSVLSPTKGSPAWRSGDRRRWLERIQLWRSVGFDCRNATLGGYRVSYTWGLREKKQWPPKRLGQTYLLGLEGLLWRQGAAVAHCRDKDTGCDSSREHLLVWALLDAPLFSPRSHPTASARTPQANQPTEQEHSPTQQQTACLKSWENSCPIKTVPDTALPTRGTRPSSTHLWASTSSSHQEACISLLDSCTCQGQRAEARTTTLQPEELSESRTKWDTPEEQLGEVETGNLPQREFRVMIVKMSQDLRRGMEAQIRKIQEISNKDLEDLKNKDEQYNNWDEKYTRRNQWQNIWGRRINELEDRMVEITAMDQNNEEKNEQKWGQYKRSWEH